MVGLPLGTDSEFFPAASPAAGEDCTSVLGFHTGAEAVGLRAVTVIRLKSTFRHFSSSIYSIDHRGNGRQIGVGGLAGLLLELDWFGDCPC
jgi:hypothetical protein